MTETEAKQLISDVVVNYTDDYKIVGFGAKPVNRMTYKRRYGIAVSPENATPNLFNDLLLLAANNASMTFGGAEPMLNRADVLVEYLFMDVEYETVRGGV